MLKFRTALLGIGTAALLATGSSMTAGAAEPASVAGAHMGSVSAADQAGGGGRIWKKCPVGAVCLYTKKDGQGTVHKIYADTNKNRTHISALYNHGDTSSAYDHVKLKINVSGRTIWTCLKPGERKSGNDYTVDAVRWVKSC